jgi:hypothetical protein
MQGAMLHLQRRYRTELDAEPILRCCAGLVRLPEPQWVEQEASRAPGAEQFSMLESHLLKSPDSSTRTLQTKL